MKEYLPIFRDQVFNGALMLLKRVLLSNIIISILLSILSFALIVPLILKTFSLSFVDFIGLRERMQDTSKIFTNPNDIKAFYMQMFGHINSGYLFVTILVGILFSAFQYVVFFKLNDNVVRQNNTSMMDAIRMSLSSQIFSMIGLYIGLVAISCVILGGYILVLTPLFMAAKVLGALVGFILFFVLVILIIRFLIAPAALIHGNMKIGEAISYSFNKITWKRGGILFLMSLVFIIGFLLVSITIKSITGAIFGFNNATITSVAIRLIISATLRAFFIAFLYCSLTSIYFRYSDDDDITEDNKPLIN